MSLQHETLASWELPKVTQSYTVRDSILYAIGVGASIEPIDATDMSFLYEGRGLVTVPTMPTVIGQRARWMDDPRLEIDWRKIVHGEQALTIHELLPPEAAIASVEKVRGVFDKGREKGAVIWVERTIASLEGDHLFSSLLSSYFLRGDGGFGGSNTPHALAGPEVPKRAPDVIVDLPTRTDQAIIYRLSGDMNPLHADQEFAVNAGFPGPILHGLCTYAIAGRAVTKTICGDDPSALFSIAARFSSVVFPGETVRTELWRHDGGAAFRCRTVERDVIVVDNGLAMLRKNME